MSTGRATDVDGSYNCHDGSHELPQLLGNASRFGKPFPMKLESIYSIPSLLHAVSVRALTATDPSLNKLQGML